MNKFLFAITLFVLGNNGWAVTPVLHVDAVQNQYEKVKSSLSTSHPDNISRDVQKAVASIYQKGGSDSPSLLKYLLRNNELSAEHGKLLWQVRNHWLSTAVKEICAEHKISIGLLDSGTEGSVANDTDKTLSILNQQGKLTEEEVIELLKKKVTEVIKRQTGVSDINIASLDIELFSGKNLFSSAFTAKAPATYKVELNKVMEKLAKNHYAYATDGAIKSQVILRALDKEKKLEKGLMAVGSAFDQYEYDPKTKQVTQIQPDDWVDLLMISKDISPQDAWGASLGNQLMLQDKLDKLKNKKSNFADVQDDLAKYLMRSVVDTYSMKKHKDGQSFKRYSMDDFKSASSRQKLIADLTKLAADDLVYDDYQIMLSISDKLLQNKNNRSAGKKVLSDDVIFKELIDVLALKNPNLNRAEYLAEARQIFVKKSEEMSMLIMQQQFPDAVTTWLKPDKKLLEKAQRRSDGFENENIRILAMVQLAGAYNQLNKRVDKNNTTEWQKLVAAAPMEQQQDLENLARMLKWESKSKQKVIDLKEKAMLDQWQKTKQSGLKQQLQIKAEDFWRWTADKVENTRLGLQGIQNRIDMQTILASIQEKAKNVALDQLSDVFGKSDALMSIIQSYQHTEGQPDAQRKAIVMQAILGEVISEIPVAGDIHGFYQTATSGDTKQQIQLSSILWERLASKIFSTNPVAAPVIMYVDFSTQIVRVVGHEIFYPLRQDYINIILKGYHEPSEAGLLRAGRNVPDGFQVTAYKPILSYVDKRFVILQGDLLHKLMNDPNANSNAVIALGKEAEASGEQFSVVVDLKTNYRQKIQALKEQIHYLGGPGGNELNQAYRSELASGLSSVVQKWQNQATIADYINNKIKEDPRIAFEVQRQNIYRHFKNQVQQEFSLVTGQLSDVESLYKEYDQELKKVRQQLWQVRGASLEAVDKARRKLQQLQKDLKRNMAKISQQERIAVEQYFLSYVKDWLHANGDFKQDDENIALKFVWHDEETQKIIANRLSDAYLSAKNPTLAVEGNLQIIKLMDKQIEKSALQRHSHRLSILYKKMQPSLPEVQPFVDALAPDLDYQPNIEVNAVIIQPRDEKSEKQLQIEISVQATREHPADEWELQAPPKILPTDVEHEFEVIVEVVNKHHQQKIGVGKARLELVEDSPPQQEAIQQQADVQIEQVQSWVLDRILLVHKPAQYPYTSKYENETNQLQVEANENGIHIIGLTDVKEEVRNCPEQPDHFKTLDAYEHRHMYINIAPKQIEDRRGAYTGVPFEVYQKGELQILETWDSKSYTSYSSDCKKKRIIFPAGAFFKIKSEQVIISKAGIESPIVLPHRTPIVIKQVGVGYNDNIQINSLSSKNVKTEKQSLIDLFNVEVKPNKRFRTSYQNYDIGKLYKHAFIKTYHVSKELPKEIAIRIHMEAYLTPEVKDKDIIFDFVYKLQTGMSDKITPKAVGFDKPIEQSIRRAWGDAQQQIVRQNNNADSGSRNTQSQSQIWQQAQQSLTQDNTTRMPGYEPWNSPQIQSFIDDWLSQAIPLIALEHDGNWGYSRWGQITGPGIIIAGKPEGTGGRSRYQVMWDARNQFDSINLCSLEEYIERSINNKPLNSCKKQRIAKHKPKSKFKPQGTLQDVDKIPTNEWLYGKPILKPVNTLILFSNNPKDFLVCGKQAKRIGMQFVGLSQLIDLSQLIEKSFPLSFKTKVKGINIAAGRNTYIVVYDVWDKLSKENHRKLNGFQALLVDKAGKLLRWGDCQLLLGKTKAMESKK